MNCPRCGHKNVPDSRYCNKCGSLLAAGAAPLPAPQSASAKSIVALILGILSIIAFGFLTGIPAMIVAKSEEDDIRAGRSSVAGEMLAKLGFWLGLIGTILSGLVVLLILLAIFSAFSIPFIFGCGI